MNTENIRNFSIIAHIDHGKSTLADRMLELTNTIEKRKMKDQVLDRMDLERERGITIKMQPVRMVYHPHRRITQKETQNYAENSGVINEIEPYVLNLIDTPGHIDFSYEVSRSLKAVEGAVLLVDSTQGVQAQTLTTLDMAKKLSLVIVPVLSKIDSSLARIEETKTELSKLLQVEENQILEVSGKTGQGVEELLEEIVIRIPSPANREDDLLRNSALVQRNSASALQALVFDYEYSTHRGIIVYSRVFDGRISKGDNLRFAVTGESASSLRTSAELIRAHPGPVRLVLLAKIFV